MGRDEYALVKALMDKNEEMRVIAVGDDDQNIYEFRGSDSRYLYDLSRMEGSRFVEMTENYRSASHIVAFVNGFAQGIRHRMKSTPIVSKRNDAGWVELTFYQSRYMYEPLVEQLLRCKGGGTSCVLTQTNEEAVVIAALLRKRGMNSKLIQSMDGFRFWNLAETRYFLRYLRKRAVSPMISEELWEDAKRAVFSVYARSRSLDYLKRCIELFEQTSKARYLSDFSEFVFESSVEDFCDVAGADVVVSTIHKSKGREFDDVYMLLSAQEAMDDALMRRYYVGMTRAKNRLFVHTDLSMKSKLNSLDQCRDGESPARAGSRGFGGLEVDRRSFDPRAYALPSEVVLSLTHKDVYLDFFKKVKREVLALQSGDPLVLQGVFLCNPATGLPVATLSSSMQKSLEAWSERGYSVRSASVRFVVAWRPKEAPKEEPDTAVLLADLTLSI